MYRLLQLEYCKRSVSCTKIATFYGTYCRTGIERGIQIVSEIFEDLNFKCNSKIYFVLKLWNCYRRGRQSRRRKEEKHFEPAANRSNLMITFGCSLWPLTQATAAVATTVRL